MSLIKVENKGYGLYEELLLKRDRLKKEAHILQGRFVQEFGDLITAIFEKKISCIQKKKIIAYYQSAVNRGIHIDQTALQNYIQLEMKEYQLQLKQMIEENEAAHQMSTISLSDMAKIKKIYYRLVKILHPDINPKTSEIPVLKELWNMVSVAYNSNSLDDMEEAEVLIQRALKDYHILNMVIEIPNLDDKIRKVEEEIKQIKDNIPYQYKYLLEDKSLVAEQKESLQEELKDYTNYEQELDQILKQLNDEGVDSKWKIN